MKDLLNALNFKPKEGSSNIFIKYYKDYFIEVDFNIEQINFDKKIKTEFKNSFKDPESWVDLECVDRLLEKGYKPENIILEKTWKLGHQEKGRLDILITDENNESFMMIECKTFGSEFEKELKNTKKNGGQLFSYFQQDKNAKILMLYASEFQNGKVVYKNEIIKVEEEYKSASNLEDLYDKWNKLTKDNGVFEEWVKPYNFISKALTSESLKPITEEDSHFIFNQFAEILRHNVVSDKGNAFNKIFTLFLCKVYDEKITKSGDELKFQWLEGKDNHVDFQIRLTDLYKSGMLDFLEKQVTDFSEEDFDREYKNLDEKYKVSLRKKINELRLEKNNEFAIKEVFDHQSFLDNAVVVKEVVELLQGFRIRYNKRQQYLSDFFELLLTTGLKQESGQFFTPVPVAQFIIRSLPIDKIIDQKLKNGERNNLLPYIIDYSAGSGHFLTESMHEIQNILDKKISNNFIPDTAKKIKAWQEDHFDWATQYVYGIEKDYRLVKVGKVGCYLHGDGLANVILSDGLANFSHKEYKGKLSENKNSPQFDIVVSNPPYSVSAFKNNSRDYYNENDFELYKYLTDDSSEIEALFIERTKQLLKDGSVAGIILPSSILSNSGIYTKAREIIFKYFDIVAITELGSNTFMATDTKTVVLFLKRKNDYEYINIKKSIEKFFSDFSEVTINTIEKPITKYISHVFKDVSFSDYVSLIQKNPNQKIKSTEIYKEYEIKIKNSLEKSLKNNKEKIEKEFWKLFLEIEIEKLIYFIMSYTKKVVIVKTGEKDEEKKFLGYKFSDRKGSEGIHAMQKGKRVADCTRLFDENDFENPEKASAYIYKAFNNDLDFPIVKSLEKNIFRQNLVDIMTFDRVNFEKTISLSIKKKVKIESRWPMKKLGDVSEVKNGFAFKSEDYTEKGLRVIRIKNVQNGFVQDNDPVFISASRKLEFKEFILNEDDILISMTGNPGRVAKIKENNLPALLNQRVGKINILDKNILKDYFFNYLNTDSFEEEVVYFSKGLAQLNVSSSQIEEIKIPVPPIEIQQKIVNEMNKVEEKEERNKNEIFRLKQEVIEIFENAYKNSKEEVRMSDKNIFEVSIGQRVLKNELLENGVIPVYSANVFEPFGYVDNTLFDDFTDPSVLFGIDGDWMVNVIEKEKSFYPTDHCGVIRVKNNSINEKYLAFVLEKEGKALEFSRTKRASIERIEGIKIKVYTKKDGEKIFSKIENIEEKIKKIENEILEIKNEKENILKKYL